MEELTPLGWDQQLAASWSELDATGCTPVRVIADFGSMLRIATPVERKAEISGRLLHFAHPADLPKVGDWVAAHITDKDATIQAVIPRINEISRKAAGEKVERQILATNINVAFIVQALDHDFSPKRIERYLFQLNKSNIKPVLVLNKSDTVKETSGYAKQIEPLGIPYIICSAVTGRGVGDLIKQIQPGETAVLLGSSGVGKSSLTNRLLGKAVQQTQAVREDDGKGRHTTIHRELFTLEGGGLLIDTPGIRELQLWGSEDELKETFDDIAELAAQCRFNNCTHGAEPGCAIQEALADGSLSQTHYGNFLKMKRELQYLQTQNTPDELRQKKRAISKALKQQYKTDRSSLKDAD